MQGCIQKGMQPAAFRGPSLTAKIDACRSPEMPEGTVAEINPHRYNDDRYNTAPYGIQSGAFMPGGHKTLE